MADDLVRRQLQKAQGIACLVVDNGIGPNIGAGTSDPVAEPMVGAWLARFWERAREAALALITLRPHSHEGLIEQHLRIRAANLRSDGAATLVHRKERSIYEKRFGKGAFLLPSGLGVVLMRYPTSFAWRGSPSSTLTS